MNLWAVAFAAVALAFVVDALPQAGVPLAAIVLAVLIFDSPLLGGSASLSGGSSL